MAYLDPAPIPAPAVKPIATGRKLDFASTVKLSGMKNVVSTFDPPDVRIHNGDRDFKAVSPGRVVYCIAERNIPHANEMELAREVMRRLAYGFHDWAAREVVSRYHRDLKREVTKVQRQPPELMRASLKIKRFLRSNPGATVGEIADGTGIAQPNVSRTLRQWHNEGRIEVVREGRVARSFVIENQEEPSPTEKESIPTPAFRP